nr:uncharacterized protein LOC105727349 [Aotus nancymaae]
MLCSAKLYHRLPPSNESLENREAAHYVTIMLFASLSCCQERAGMVGSSRSALRSNKSWSGKRNPRHRCLFCKPLAALSKLPGAAGDCGVNAAGRARDNRTELAASPSRGPLLSHRCAALRKENVAQLPSQHLALLLGTRACGLCKPLKSAREEENGPNLRIPFGEEEPGPPAPCPAAPPPGGPSLSRVLLPT